ncbi:solute carrier family 12 [Trichuris trichiura]|uniref:Solute carrier family 12 n=1 Tax=Trichuris trichiura TaxID=36087 RepID=A0A077Z5N4_TRITR|nr:solute carrier family 12 [Trichuris trichiura]
MYNRQILTGRILQKAKLGTLLGVYLPTIQNVFGVIMFIRLHWVVGMAGLFHALIIVVLCCLVTFFTSISLAAIATNGIFEEGGPYFVIARNLSPEFGGAIGVLFFLANAVATSMYVVGNIEVLLTYVAPELPQFGNALTRTDTDMANTFRIYGSFLLVFMFLVVCAGVRFTQMFAPISLACVIVSIASVYIGVFVIDVTTSPQICLVGEKVIKYGALGNDQPLNVTCSKAVDGILWKSYCAKDNNTGNVNCDPYFMENDVRIIDAVPGLNSDLSIRNFWPHYLLEGESAPRLTGRPEVEVTQDITSDFFVLLAIFFPAVTGIMTGCNMSGDLDDPQKSIPLGTISAQLTTSFVFISFIVFYGCTVERPLLTDKYGDSLGGRLVSGKIAWPTEWTMVAGVLASTFGAGLQSLFCAARLIQPVAKDELIPFLKPLGKLNKWNEPFRALLLAYAIAELSILIGAVDHIAPIVDFFFLMCYCFINIVCTLQTLLKAPNWRPRFRFYHWSLSLIGAILAFFIMIATHWEYAIVVIVMCISIHRYIEYRGAKKEWGHGTQGLALTAAHYSLLKIEDKDIHPKNWRPQLQVYLKFLLPTDNLINETSLVLAGMLKGGQGLLMITSFICVKEFGKHTDAAIASKKKMIKSTMSSLGIRGFVRVIPCTNLAEAMCVNTLGAGIGGLRPNTVMLRWPTHWMDYKRLKDVNYWTFIHAIFCTATSNMCLLLPKGEFPTLKDTVTGYIDVWWFAQDGGLLILLPCLLRRHSVWRNCQTRIFAVVDPVDDVAEVQSQLENWVYQLRVEAKVKVVVISNSNLQVFTAEREKVILERKKLAIHLGLSKHDQSKEHLLHFSECPFKGEEDMWNNATRQMRTALHVNQVIRKISSLSKLVILNLPLSPKHQELMPVYLEHVEALTDKLPTVLLARGSGKEVITVFS